MGPVLPPAPRYAVCSSGRVGRAPFRGCPGQFSRCDACRSPRVPSHHWCDCPEGLWHRDARRIGPVPPGRNLASHTVSHIPAGSSEPAFIVRFRFRRPGPVRRRFWPESLSRIAWRFRSRFPPVVPAFLLPGRSHAFRLPFRLLRSCRPDCAPFAASAVRVSRSEEHFPRVFRHCCGHRCQHLEVMFSPFLSTVSRWKLRCGLTSRHLKAAPQS